MDTERAAKVALINDLFRKNGFHITLTNGVHALEDTIGLINAIRVYDVFNEDNDPWGEHDFGIISWHNNTVYWKIDYYDHKFEHGEDPLSVKCRRIMSVMLADEY